MKTLKISIVVILSLISTNSFSQLTVLSDGSVQIVSMTPNWGSALRTYVFNILSCAYHLNYSGTDVFYVCAQGYTWSYGGYMIGSDLKFKSNIKSIDNPINKIKKLNGIEFTYKLDSITNNGNKINNNDRNHKRLGFIAQEVEKVIPGIVKTMPDSTKAISYTDLIPLLIEGMKVQQIQIDSLITTINSQKQDIIKLKSTIH